MHTRQGLIPDSLQGMRGHIKQDMITRTIRGMRGLNREDVITRTMRGRKGYNREDMITRMMQGIRDLNRQDMITRTMQSTGCDTRWDDSEVQSTWNIRSDDFNKKSFWSFLDGSIQIRQPFSRIMADSLEPEDFAELTRKYVIIAIWRGWWGWTIRRLVWTGLIIR